ncbi:MAG: hypothetical protein LBP59_08250 [Planctomycetaceae bacterium]|nr:hypothetical protein [Planctomycetaceae bacterium]
MSEVLIATAFLVAYRQHAGGTPAIRWSCLLFRIAGGLARKRLYSTANERGFALNRFFVCLAVKCRQDAMVIRTCHY